MFVLGDWMGKEWDTGTYSSPNESPDRGGKKMEAKWLARTLRWKWELLPSAEVGNKKISFWTEVVVNESKAKTPGKGRRKVSWTRSHTFKPELKITKSVSPLKRKYSPQESIGIRQVNFKTVSPYTQLYILSLSLSIWGETKEERKEDIYVYVLSVNNIAKALNMCINVFPTCWSCSFVSFATKLFHACFFFSFYSPDVILA